MGSATNDTTRELGGALGVAVLGSLLTERYASQVADAVGGLPAQARQVAESSLGGVHGLVAQGIVPADSSLVTTAKEAFVSGQSLAAIVGAVVVVIAALMVRRFLPADRGSTAVTGGPPSTGGSDAGEPATAPIAGD